MLGIDEAHGVGYAVQMGERDKPPTDTAIAGDADERLSDRHREWGARTDDPAVVGIDEVDCGEAARLAALLRRAGVLRLPA